MLASTVATRQGARCSTAPKRIQIRFGPPPFKRGLFSCPPDQAGNDCTLSRCRHNCCPRGGQLRGIRGAPHPNVPNPHPSKLLTCRRGLAAPQRNPLLRPRNKMPAPAIHGGLHIPLRCPLVRPIHKVFGGNPVTRSLLQSWHALLAQDIRYLRLGEVFCRSGRRGILHAVCPDFAGCIMGALLFRGQQLLAPPALP